MDESHLTMQKPRRTVKTFVAKYAGTCDKCYLEILPGERVRYNEDDRLVHHTHKAVERVEKICDTCRLVKPCECD